MNPSSSDAWLNRQAAAIIAKPRNSSEWFFRANFSPNPELLDNFVRTKRYMFRFLFLSTLHENERNWTEKGCAQNGKYPKQTETRNIF